MVVHLCEIMTSLLGEKFFYTNKYSFLYLFVLFIVVKIASLHKPNNSVSFLGYTLHISIGIQRLFIKGVAVYDQ